VQILVFLRLPTPPPGLWVWKKIFAAVPHQYFTSSSPLVVRRFSLFRPPRTAHKPGELSRANTMLKDFGILPTLSFTLAPPAAVSNPLVPLHDPFWLLEHFFLTLSNVLASLFYLNLIPPCHEEPPPRRVVFLVMPPFPTSGPLSQQSPMLPPPPRAFS